MLRTLTAALLVAGTAAGQSLPITHTSSGLDAASARTRIERGRPRPYGPRAGAAGMGGGTAIRVVKPTVRLTQQTLGIADAYDAFFFGDDRLVHLRVYLRTTGKSLADRWTEQLRTYFDFLDRDGNGSLNRAEAEFALSNAGVVQMARTGFAYQRPDDAGRMFAALDTDEDGRASFDEFAAYYSPSAADVVSAQASPFRDTFADALTAELFQRLDANADGKLSRSEVAGLGSLFGTLDADEDECLSAPELAANVFNGRAKPSPRADESRPMIVALPGQAPDAVLQAIFKQYDRDRSLSLSRPENPFGAGVFELLDADHNGAVSVTELIAYGSAPPDLEVEMTLGDKPGEGDIRLRPRADGKPNPAASGFKITGPGTAIMTVGKQAVQFWCHAPGVTPPAARGSVVQFPNTKDGFVTEKDIAGPQYQALRILFDLIDRNADGKMSRAEFDAFRRLQETFTRLPLTLLHSAQTPSLFQVLDENGDGRLSGREVRQAWARLIALEPTEKDAVTRAALRPQGALRFGRAGDVMSFNPTTMYTRPPVRQATQGPLWFRKFDRNGDGELSRTEFPGPRTAFDRIDTDHDDYILLAEAEAADRALRVRK